MLLEGLFGPITLYAHHIQNHGVMDQAINGGHRGHGIFENALPFAEDEVGGDHHRFAFIALSQEREQDLHFITVVLDVADIVEDHTSKLVQFRKLLRQTQVPLCCQKSLDKGARGRPEDGVASLDDCIPNRCQTMTFTPSIEMPS